MNHFSVAFMLALGIAAGSATAEQERHVRVFFQVKSTVVTGDTVPSQFVNTLLFLDEPRLSKIVGAANMHRAWWPSGMYQVGCWYPTLDDNYVFIDGSGKAHRQPYWEALPRARLNPDGSVTITEPAYDSKTFMSNVMNAKILQQLDHIDERP